MSTTVKGTGYGSVLMVGANLLLVAWVTGLRGGTLDTRRAQSVPMPG